KPQTEPAVVEGAPPVPMAVKNFTIPVNGAAADATPPRLGVYPRPGAPRAHLDTVPKVFFNRPVSGVTATTFTVTDASGTVRPSPGRRPAAPAPGGRGGGRGPPSSARAVGPPARPSPVPPARQPPRPRRRLHRPRRPPAPPARPMPPSGHSRSPLPPAPRTVA